MDDSKDTVIVTGCTGMTGKEFIETVSVFGKIKVNNDGENIFRILPEKGIGIVTFKTPKMAENAREMLNGQELHGNRVQVFTAAQYFQTSKPLNGYHDRHGINTAWKMWYHNLESAGGKGGKGGAGFLGGLFRGQDGLPGQPGPNGKGGEGGKRRFGIFKRMVWGSNGKDGDGGTGGNGRQGGFGNGNYGEGMGCGKGGKGGFGKGKDGQSWRDNANHDRSGSGGQKPRTDDFSEHGSDVVGGEIKQNGSGIGGKGCSFDGKEFRSYEGGAGGKGGAGLFGLFKGKDGQPGNPGPNGQGGKGGKGGSLL